VISEDEVAEGARLARQAIETGAEDPDALWMGGWGSLVLAAEGASGLSAIERALSLNPNSALAWNFCGWARASPNQPASAIEALQRAMRLSPLDPQRWAFYGGLALAHLVAGRYEEALEWADRALHENPRMTAVVGFKAAACGHLGRVEEGRQCVRRWHELLPGNTAASAKRAVRFISPEVLAITVEGYRKAGLPEE
jgi:tetratricopeptide (TPR) repeat protein